MTAGATLTTITLGTPDPRGLAVFWSALLGWPVAEDDGDETWVVVRDPSGGVGVACQREPDHVPPVWPGGPGDQQMQVHLEVRVDDLAAGVEHALACGARLAEHQPQDDVRVVLDPAGHPFCLWVA